MTNKSSFMVSHGPSVSRLGVELHGEACIFRNRSGAPYSKDTRLAMTFRTVRRERGSAITSSDERPWPSLSGLQNLLRRSDVSVQVLRDPQGRAALKAVLTDY
jgi:hypothetical protein